MSIDEGVPRTTADQRSPGSILREPRIDGILQRSLARMFFRGGSTAKKRSGRIVRRYLRSVGLKNVAQIPSYTSESELVALFQVALECPPGSVGLEIGSHLGASSCYLAAGLSKMGGHLYCVDTWHNETMPDGTRDTFSEFRKNTAGISTFITAVRKRSEELVYGDIRGPVQLAFIDADHSYEAVSSDFQKMRDWLARDAVVAFHDAATWQGVSKFVGELVSSGEWRIAGNAESLVWIRPTRWTPRPWLET